MTDTERINWLEEQEGWALVSDDAGRWAVTTSGMQNVPDSDKAIDINTTFWIEADEWKNNIRQAIDFAMEMVKSQNDIRYNR
jgi:hypothetical protein